MIVTIKQQIPREIDKVFPTACQCTVMVPEAHQVKGEKERHEWSTGPAA
jgi:hypothetical protein